MPPSRERGGKKPGGAVRRLLIVTYHFPPSAASGAFRMLGFARHLPKYGWNVSVVAPPTLPWEAVDPQLIEKVPSETVIYHTPYSTASLTKPLRKFAPYASWLPRALKSGCRATEATRPDLLLTSGPPHGIHLVGNYLKRRYGIPWAADFRDPWVVGRPPQASVGLWAPRVERRVLREADVVIWNTRGVCNELREMYPHYDHKMITIPNGYDPDTFNAGPRPSLPEASLEILHAGMIYLGRDPRPFLDALGGLQMLNDNSSDCSLIASFVGANSRSRTDISVEARARGLEAVVRVEDSVPYAESLRRMAGAGILLLLDSPGRRTGVPAKLYEYIGAGRPILALGERGGDLEWVLRESGRPHRIVAPSDRDAIRQALLELAAEARGGSLSQAAGRGAGYFTREGLTGRLAENLDRCLAGGVLQDGKI